MEVKLGDINTNRQIITYTIESDYRVVVYSIDDLSITLMADKIMTRESDRMVITIAEKVEYWSIESAYMSDNILIVIIVNNHGR